MSTLRSAAGMSSRSKRLVQLFFDKKAKTLKNAAIATYVVYAILLNVLDGRALRLVGDRYILLGVLSLCCSDKVLAGERNREHKEIPVYLFAYSVSLPLRSGVLICVG